MIQESNRTWSDAPVVIDAANVAGSSELSGCGKFCWDRVDVVRKAWRDQIDPDAKFAVVMDTAPANQLGPTCKRRYRDERTAGAVSEVDFGDPEILRIAEEQDAAVITGDFYKDERRRHPWVDGNQDQFFKWEVTNGRVVIVARDMLVPSDFSKTRAEEQAELKALGADVKSPAVERALRQTYRCDNNGCWLHRYDPGRYTGVPNLRDPQQPRCAACGQLLIAIGESPRLVQVKFADPGRAQTERRTLSPDDFLVIGRDSSDELVSKVLGDGGGLISREHARIDWDGSRLSITDLGSKNGTTVRRWAGKQRGYEPELAVHGSTSLNPRDEVRLAGVLLITRSARTFRLEAEPILRRPTTANPPTIAQHGPQD
jgi:pSer/pThr/pTyr-binding forkhead associated (FHA) protein